MLFSHYKQTNSKRLKKIDNLARKDPSPTCFKNSGGILNVGKSFPIRHERFSGGCWCSLGQRLISIDGKDR